MKDPSNNENKNINKIKILEDISFNLKINHIFNDLQDCSNNKNIILIKDNLTNISLENSIKYKKNTFYMKLTRILNKIKNENNNLDNDYLSNLKNKLDDIENNKITLNITPIDKNNSNYKRKRLLDALLENINIDYNNLKDDPFNINKKPNGPPPPPPLFNKNKIWHFRRPRLPPPPPPKRFFNNKNSIYIPPKRKNSFLNPLFSVPEVNKENQDEEEKKIEKKKVNIECSIDSIDDLLKLIEDYPLKPDIEYNIDMESIHNIKEPLDELNNMIGMNNLKDNIVDQIIYFIQKLHLTEHTKNGDFMHTVIYGPPGTGKTEIAKIIGKLFSGLGVLSNNIFRKATRADFIAGYLGQTALKTKDLVKDCLGGVLFIDEAYALGNPEKRDSFAKECIDTLCEALSDHKENLMVIIAGYEEDLDKCFFAYNQGLNSRFPWRFKTDDYKAKELKLIFEKKVHDISWSFAEEIKTSWFEKNIDYFKFYGRDMETLFSKTKIAHSKRVFCKPKCEKTKLNKNDVEKGFKMFIDNNEVKNRKDTAKMKYKEFMYI